MFNSLHTHSNNVVSYALGPLHTSQVTEQACQLPNGLEYTLLIPQGLPSIVLDNPDFLQDCEFGYSSCDDLLPSPMALANWIYTLLQDDFHLPNAHEAFHPYPSIAAFAVGWLSALAETDRTLALVGLAHLLFLLSYMPATDSLPILQRELGHAWYRQKQALQDYRARVRDLRAQGVELQAAYQQAYALPQYFLASCASALAPAHPQLS